MAIFHGVEADFNDNVVRTPRVVNTAVAFIVGSAPIYELTVANQLTNELVRVSSDVDDSTKVGPATDGFTLPEALNILRNYGASDVEVVNVFDPATHKTTATSIEYTFGTTGATRGTIQLKRVSGSTPTAVDAKGLTGTFTVTGPSATPTYVLDTDYTINNTTGVLTRLTGGSIASGGTVEVTYDYADPALVDDADIIGAVTDGVRTGLQLIFDIRPNRGYRPKSILCPDYSESSTVATEMESLADSIGYGCIACLDAPAAASVSEALAGRNGTAPVANFGTSNAHAKLFYPRVYNGTDLQSLATHYAGLRYELDDERGYHYSASNYQLKNVTGIELTNISDADREQLNQQGITTIFRDFATGIRIWGNHTAGYPSDLTPYSFEAVFRAIGIIHESLVEASLPFIDKPITTQLAQAILATANGFLNDQGARNGAVVPGSEVRYLAAKNSATQLAAGTLTFSITLMIPTPAQVIRYETDLDINLLSAALEASVAA